MWPQNIWDHWKVIPLGKRFYEFAFSTLEDMRTVLVVEL